LLAGLFILLAPLGLRQYCHLKEGSVAGYSDLYEREDTWYEVEDGDANAVQGLPAGDTGRRDAVFPHEKKKTR
jgi:hypothetical protein